jgi:hypothetical protein
MPFKSKPPSPVASRREWQRYLEEVKSLAEEYPEQEVFEWEIRHAQAVVAALDGKLQWPSVVALLNRLPLNQMALRRLQEAKQVPDLSLLHLVQLLQLGFEENLPLLGQGGRYRADLELAAGQLLDHNLLPAQVMRWLLSNRNGGEQSEQNDTLLRWLEEAPNWQAAAQSLMEWFYDLKASQDPYYR